ncbi:MAG: HK97 gp10 family phage protein [Moraxella sp.]|nr:HK97 gp10 family phage protein [Moraxella sp.]
MWDNLPSLFADKVGDELDRTYRQFVMNVFNNVVMLSPVDTGRYRNAHHISIGSPSYAETGGGISMVLSLPRHSYPMLYIQNNLPYGLRLEHGHSRQAPTGVYGNAFWSAVASL